jgi:hypothetical protein
MLPDKDMPVSQGGRYDLRRISVDLFVAIVFHPHASHFLRTNSNDSCFDSDNQQTISFS